ncbi:MAG: type II toxin-antitoxin system RelE/ParE family toxin [Candidatus Limnocylindrales bacterium]
MSGRYQVELAPAAQHQLERLPPGVAASLRGPILALALEPHPPGSAKPAGTEFWRIRIGELRVVYAFDAADRVVVVLRVARRSESTYRRLR